jgi:ubiquinone/menaquinone biosynthesis C-methylase UbiE
MILRHMKTASILVASMTITMFVAGGLSLQARQAVETKKADRAKKKKEGINDQFKNPDVKSFTKRFESESREVYARRKEIADALGLKPGMGIADIGAGTGFYSRLFAERVGPTGKVYAVDVSPTFLKHIDEQSKKMGLEDRITTVKADQNSANLPPNSVDRVFICDVYHHFEHPDKELATLHQALRDGGELFIIDFDRVEGKSSEFVLKHIRASKDVFAKEIAAAGFEKAPIEPEIKLKETFMFRFKKVAKSGETPAAKGASTGAER